MTLETPKYVCSWLFGTGFKWFSYHHFSCFSRTFKTIRSWLEHYDREHVCFDSVVLTSTIANLEVSIRSLLRSINWSSFGLFGLEATYSTLFRHGHMLCTVYVLYISIYVLYGIYIFYAQVVVESSDAPIKTLDTTHFPLSATWLVSIDWRDGMFCVKSIVAWGHTTHAPTSRCQTTMVWLPGSQQIKEIAAVCQ